MTLRSARGGKRPGSLLRARQYSPASEITTALFFRCDSLFAYFLLILWLPETDQLMYLSHLSDKSILLL